VQLTKALLAQRGALQHVLDLLCCSHQYIAQNAALALLVLLRAVAAANEAEVLAAAAAAGQPVVAAAGLAGEGEAAVAAAAAANANFAANAAPMLMQDLAAAFHEAADNDVLAEADAAAEVAAQQAAADNVAQLQAASAAQQAAAQQLLQPLFDALLAEQHAGLLKLLRGIHSSSKVICVLTAAGLCMLAQAIHARLGPQAGASLMDAMLGQQQEGLTLVLQALHHELYPDAAANMVRCLAHAAPVKLLDALLSQRHRRGMQSLLRCLDGPSEHASECSGCTSIMSLEYVHVVVAAGVPASG
jgi:hypothetical protein